ncbi:DUF1311 domain-containing protein [Pseudofrancisella aestuarii]|uniref:DUF1311 domain-containing protein n=1 Tax=Pseudofrancisella aestuarii TaxID=2670347 RepID=A0ABV9T8T9_9GAMM|nr:DUF1311 domain-containing protein [Pseudofrancisella aestuarii]
MKRLLLIALLLPFFSFANECNEGNTYEINQCLKAKIEESNKAIDKIKNHNTEEFQELRNKICQNVSYVYKGGSFQSISYGNCVISLSDWYIEQTKV